MPTPATRKQHLEWAKGRALACLAPQPPPLPRLDALTQWSTDFMPPPPPITPYKLREALTSFVRDLRKHPSTEHHIAISHSLLHLANRDLDTPDAVRHFIESTN